MCIYISMIHVLSIQLFAELSNHCPPSYPRLQQRIKHLEELLASSERDFTKLEQNLVQVTKVSLTLQTQ